MAGRLAEDLSEDLGLGEPDKLSTATAMTGPVFLKLNATPPEEELNQTKSEEKAMIKLARGLDDKTAADEVEAKHRAQVLWANKTNTTGPP